MYLLNALVIVNNSDTEWFHNIISNIFQVVLVDALLLHPHAFLQLEPKLLLKVNVFV